MTIIIALLISITLLYAALMMLYAAGWRRQPAFVVPSSFNPSTRLSVVIPARNEAAKIGACIRSILAQDYPQHLIEIIVADDHSGDDTAMVAAQTGGGRVQVIFMKDEGNEGVRYKKGALAAAIRHSSGELIVTTDADCTAPPEWLKSIAALFEHSRPAMIAGPVAFTQPHSILAVFQSLDFMTMQGITAAAHRLHLGDMANGANLAFTRAAYDAVGGYSGIDGLASGDDYLLLHKMRKAFPEGIAYLKSPAAIVLTDAQPTWRAFLQQRIRWASKSGKYPDARLTAILVLVYLFNCAILAASVAGFWDAWLWLIAAIIIIIKWMAELAFLRPVARFYRRRNACKWLLPLQPVHIAYIVAAGLFGMMGSYTWKGRELR